jgi:hypothetical protein
MELITSPGANGQRRCCGSILQAHYHKSLWGISTLPTIFIRFYHVSVFRAVSLPGDISAAAFQTSLRFTLARDYPPSIA